MDLRFRHRQDGERYDERTVLTKYTASWLEKSMAFSNHRRVQFLDGMHASVLSFQGKWYAVGLLTSTCTCGHFQYNDIPCGHAIVVIQTYRDPAGGQRRSAREFITYNRRLDAFKATDTESMLPVDVEPRGENNCRAPLFKEACGRPLTACLRAGEPRAREAVWHGTLQNIPDRTLHCSSCGQECYNVERCPVIPAGIEISIVTPALTATVVRPGWSGRGFTRGAARGEQEGG